MWLDYHSKPGSKSKFTICVTWRLVLSETRQVYRNQKDHYNAMFGAHAIWSFLNRATKINAILQLISNNSWAFLDRMIERLHFHSMIRENSRVPILRQRLFTPNVVRTFLIDCEHSDESPEKHYLTLTRIELLVRLNQSESSRRITPAKTVQLALCRPEAHTPPKS